MSNLLKKAYIAAATGGITAFPFLVFAAVPPSTTGVPAAPTLTSVTGLISLIENVAGWFETIVFVVAIIMILFAAFQFLTAAGNEEKVTSARKSLLWGLVGIVVALFARVAATVIRSFLST